MNFVTIFYANYWAKGMCFYNSLERVSEDFHLYILAMDDVCASLLRTQNMKHATIITLPELEAFYPDLLSVKSQRNKGEYSWTCKGPVILYCLQKYSLADCAYLDSDVYFYSDPAVLFDEDKNADVMLTKHNYTQGYDLSEANGSYCAQFLYFRATNKGMDVLQWWTDLCIEWCYSSIEPGRFGDQKYLDRFKEREASIHDIQHIGVCAPWNIQQYSVSKDGKVYVQKEDARCELVFYHFHFVKNMDFGKYNEFQLGPYNLSCSVLSNIYAPYIKDLIYYTKIADESGVNDDVLASVKHKMSKLRFALHWLKSLTKRNKRLWQRR